MNDTYKFTGEIPYPLALRFTEEARIKSLRETGKMRGAISRAVQEAIKLWLAEEEGNRE
jgi:hypothetical protein